MALIKCPHCQQRISSLAKQCTHCHQTLTGDNESLQRSNHIKRSTRLLNQGMFTMLLFIIGISVGIWGGEFASGKQAIVAWSFGLIGFIGYLITRVQMVLHKRKGL